MARDTRGKGFGKCLLTHFVRKSEEKQAEEIWLEVRAGNLAAVNLYRNTGFELIETRKNYYPAAANKNEDALIMKYHISTT